MPAPRNSFRTGRLAVLRGCLLYGCLLSLGVLGAAGHEERIQRVENGLVVGTAETGGESRHSIAERMAHHKAPGASIAVIDGGEIAWARGYGVTEAGTSNPVTPETLFQVLGQYGEHGKQAQRSRRGLITPRSRLLAKHAG